MKIIFRLTCILFLSCIALDLNAKHSNFAHHRAFEDLRKPTEKNTLSLEAILQAQKLARAKERSDINELLDILENEHTIILTPEEIAWLAGYKNWCTSQNINPIELFNHMQKDTAEITALKTFCEQHNIPYTTALDLVTSRTASDRSFKTGMRSVGCLAVGGILGGTAVHNKNKIIPKTVGELKVAGRAVAQSDALALLAEIPVLLHLPPAQEIPLKIAIHSVIEIGTHTALSSEFLRKETTETPNTSDQQRSFLQKLLPSDPMLEKIQNPKQFVYENAYSSTGKDYLYLLAKAAVHQCEKPATIFCMNTIHAKGLHRQLKAGKFVIITTDDAIQVGVSTSAELLKYACMHELSANIQKNDTDQTKLPALKASTALYLLAHKTTAKVSENIIKQAYQEYARPLIPDVWLKNADTLEQYATPWIATVCATHCFNLAKFVGNSAGNYFNSSSAS